MVAAVPIAHTALARNVVTVVGRCINHKGSRQRAFPPVVATQTPPAEAFLDLRDEPLPSRRCGGERMGERERSEREMSEWEMSEWELSESVRVTDRVPTAARKGTADIAQHDSEQSKGQAALESRSSQSSQRPYRW